MKIYELLAAKANVTRVEVAREDRCPRCNAPTCGQTYCPCADIDHELVGHFLTTTKEN